MSGDPAHILNAGEAMKPQLINKLTIAAFRAFKKIGTSSEGNCNAEFTRAKQASNAGKILFVGLDCVSFLFTPRQIHHACS